MSENANQNKKSLLFHFCLSLQKKILKLFDFVTGKVESFPFETFLLISVKRTRKLLPLSFIPPSFFIEFLIPFPLLFLVEFRLSILHQIKKPPKKKKKERKDKRYILDMKQILCDERG